MKTCTRTPDRIEKNNVQTIFRPKLVKRATAGMFELACALSVLLLLTLQSHASSFSFSNGNVDGRIATASRPGPTNGVNQETETGDDFLLTDQTAINQATFTGLLPAGLTSSDISEVRVEIYRVFPLDSDTNRTPHVPTRVNSPSDVELVDRDTASGNLSFTVTLLSSNFTVTNSVDTGIHPSPNQLTHGDGPVSGQEVTFNTTFSKAFSLAAGHYFFIPQVLLNNPDQHFLWLSSVRPIVAPGTPFMPDLQSWIRNAELDPDWLRIGTDIIGGTTFNAAFTLSGETDADGDGVGDSQDNCPNTAPNAIVDSNGCSIDQLAPCAGPASGGTWRNHGEYVSSVAQAAEQFLEQGLITQDEADAIVGAAAQSNCGFRPR